VIDTSAWSKVRGSLTPGTGDLAYVIVADTLESRIEVCLAALKSYSLGVLVARNGDEALGLIRRFGAPVLLIVDLSLPAPDGFAVIDAACHAGGRTGIVAWSTIRGLREFAANQLRGDHVRVLRGGAAPGVVQRAIVRVLGSREVNDTTTRRAEPIEETMGALAAKARSICRTAGAAVYLKPPDESEFRIALKWDSDEAVPQLQTEMPRVFDWILKTGDALVLPDLPRQRKGTPTLRLRDLRGLIAVPVVSTEQQTIGILVVFDVRQFKFDSADIDALKALGRGLSAASRSPAAVESALPSPRDVVSISAQTEPAAPPPLSTAGPAAVALLDRRDGNLAIARELARVRREQRSLSVILFGVDSMSAVTAETLRESHGDLVATVAETLTGAVRGSDLAIRWSREELLVVLAGLNADEARRVAERVRAAMQAGARHPVAVSGGVAELLAEDTFETVMARADEQARLAKARGHNRVS